MTDASQVKVAGVSLLGTVSGLARHFQGIPPKLPESLRHYFLEEPDRQRWYPLADYLQLLDVLVGAVAPPEQRLDTYWLFGSLAGKRDAGVAEGDAPPTAPLAEAPFKTSLHAGQGLAVVVRRALSMRERYYNRGYYKVQRVTSHELEITLHEFPAYAELCAMSTGYLRELMRAANVGARIRRTSCKALGDDSCAWRLLFKPDVADVASLSAFE